MLNNIKHPTPCNKARKRNKSIKTGRKKCLFTDDMIAHVENSMEYIEKLLEFINKIWQDFRIQDHHTKTNSIPTNHSVQME